MSSGGVDSLASLLRRELGVGAERGDFATVNVVAVHIRHPAVVSPDQVDEQQIAKEREIFSAQAAESGKPPEIVEKMVEGRIRKYLAEVSLTEQPFVKDPDVKVGQ